MAVLKIQTDLTDRQISRFGKLFNSLFLKNGKAYFPTKEMHGVLQTKSRNGAFNIVQSHLSIVQIYIENVDDEQYIKHVGIDVLLDTLASENPKKQIHYLASRAYISAYLANDSEVFKDAALRGREQEKETIQVMHRVKKDATHCKLSGKLFKKGVECHVHHIEGVSEQPDLATDIENLIPLCKDVHDKYHKWVSDNQLAITRSTLKQFAKEFDFRTDW